MAKCCFVDACTYQVHASHTTRPWVILYYIIHNINTNNAFIILRTCVCVVSRTLLCVGMSLPVALIKAGP